MRERFEAHTAPAANRVLAHTGARYPIIQAPMGYIATGALAAAVSEAGATGVVATSGGVERCMAELAGARSRTAAPFGANVVLMLLQDESVVDAICDAGVHFVTTSAGNPARFVDRLKRRGITVYHVVPSVAAAEKAVAAGVDGLVVEGGEGGGFKSPDDVSTLVLLQAVRRAVDVPLVAAGGIVDGVGMAAAFALGAEGVQMGTRFLLCRESPVHPSYQAALLRAGETDTVMLNRTSRPAVRALKTPLAAEVLEQGGVLPPQAFARIEELYFGGDLTASVACAGQSVGLIEHVQPAADIVAETVGQFFDVMDGLAARFGGRCF
jgi:enoyl-[acyl-carrier protein] reductase II